MDRLRAMQVFVEVVSTGSFSAAAERLEMSRAMVTRHVAALEDWLDARLLQRTTRSLTLTDAGEHCLRRSQQMLALQQDVEEETSGLGDGPDGRSGQLRGQLRLTCSTSFAYAQLAAAVVDFLRQHPLLKIDLNASEGALNLVEARIDLAIRISAEPDPALIGRRLAPCASVLVASPDYLAREGEPQQPADLARHLCLSYANFGRSTWLLSRGEERCAVTLRSHFSANEATSLLQAALAGGGPALQPRYLANPHLASGRLREVLPEWSPPEMGIYALYPSRRHLSPAVRALMDFLVARFAATPW